MAHGSYTGISKEPEVLTRDMLSPYSFTELSLLFLEKQFFLRVPAAGTQVAVMLQKVKVSVAQSCLTLCDPMVCPWDSPGKNTGVGYCSLQGHLPDLAYCQGLAGKRPGEEFAATRASMYLAGLNRDGLSENIASNLSSL